MISDSSFQLSVNAVSAQIASIKERFPTLSLVQEVPLNSAADIIYGIDVIGFDISTGKSVTFQLKARPDNRDFCLEAQEVFGREKDIGFYCAGKQYILSPKTLNADYIVFSFGSSSPVILDTDTVNRIFNRLHDLTGLVAIHDKPNTIHADLRLIYVNPNRLFGYIVTDLMELLGTKEWFVNTLAAYQQTVDTTVANSAASKSFAKMLKNVFNFGI